MLSLKCPTSAATALLSKAFVALDLHVFSQTRGCRQRRFQAGPWQPAASSMQFQRAVPGRARLRRRWLLSRRGGLRVGGSRGGLLGVTPVGDHQQGGFFPR